MKSEISWMQIKAWLLENPDKTAAIVTRDATYIIKKIPSIPHITQEAILEYRSKEF